ncbi:kelch repeat protein, partial [Cooperia oncophora]
MSTRRMHLGSAVICDCLYALGGEKGEGGRLKSVEKYDPRRNDWISVAAMTKRRSYVKVEVLNGKIYAIGGFDGRTYHRSVEVFHPHGNQWIIRTYKEE